MTYLSVIPVIRCTSDTGLQWQASLPPMRTKRNMASSAGTVSPKVLLVVAGGLDFLDRELTEVEVLIEGSWYYVEPRLPAQGYDMTSTVHQDEVVFTSRHGDYIIYTCSIASLFSSCTTDFKAPGSLWESLLAPGLDSTTISYFSI